jgi:hypothetical protein
MRRDTRIASTDCAAPWRNSIRDHYRRIPGRRGHDNAIADQLVSWRCSAFATIGSDIDCHANRVDTHRYAQYVERTMTEVAVG